MCWRDLDAAQAEARCDLVGYVAVLLRVAQEYAGHVAQFTKPCLKADWLSVDRDARARSRTRQAFFRKSDEIHRNRTDVEAAFAKMDSSQEVGKGLSIRARAVGKRCAVMGWSAPPSRRIAGTQEEKR